MAYKVSLTRLAEADIDAAFNHISNAAPENVKGWLISIFESIKSLEEIPGRCPLIPEALEIRHPARHLVHGKRMNAYRIIFDIQEVSDEGPRVRVLRIWHGARSPIKPDDIGQFEH